MIGASLNRHNPRITVRGATADDIAKLCAVRRVSRSVRAVTFLFDGEPAGIGGISYEDGYFRAFCDINKDVRDKMGVATVVRCGFVVMDMIKKTGSTVFAVRDQSLGNSARFLKAMGFDFYKEIDGEEYYIWQH